MKSGTVETVKLSAIKPYWRNPRNNREAIAKVRSSIERYGYNQLIAVDRAGVIIAGHTRYLALRDLKVEEINVLVLDLPDEQARAYRLVDNKSSEISTWSDDLAAELREAIGLERDLLEDFFIDLDRLLAVESPAASTDVSAKDLARAAAKIKPAASNYESTEMACCPKCGHTFGIRA